MQKYKPNCTIRILHAVPDVGPVDIMINNQLAVRHFRCKEFTKCYKAMPGLYHFKVSPSDKNDTILLNELIQLEDGDLITFAMVGLSHAMDAELIQDRDKIRNNSKSYIRFVNASPSTSNFDIFLGKNKKTQNLTYREISPYFEEDPGAYSFSGLDALTGKVKFDHPRLQLFPGKKYSGYIVGSDTSNLEILLSLEENEFEENKNQELELKTENMTENSEHLTL